MGEAKRRRHAEDQAEHYVTNPENNLAYEVRAARITPRRLVGELLAAVAADADARRVEINVPCSGCVQCCYWPRVDVEPKSESPEDLRHLAVVQDEKGWHLRKREDGACVHLGPAGCTVHAHRPRACRAFDCRVAGLGEALFPIAEGHYAPSWFFRRDDREDQAILVAAKIGTLPLIAALMKDGSVSSFAELVGAILTGIRKHLPLARQLVEQVRRLPDAERAKLAEAGEAAAARLQKKALASRARARQQGNLEE
jgi:Fe-S-cluster containining protein